MSQTRTQKPVLTGNLDIGYTVSDGVSYGHSKNIDWAYEAYKAAKRETDIFTKAKGA